MSESLAQRYKSSPLFGSNSALVEEYYERFLADPDERRVRGAAGRARVLAEHTFDRRVEALLAALERTEGVQTRG